MTSASPEQRAQHNRTYYEKNKADRRRRTKELRDANTAYVQSTKRGKPCMDCGGIFPPVCMDYDHVRGEKTCNVSEAAVRGLGLARIDAEIAKCDLVCSNCHRVRTFTRSTGSQPV